MKTPFKYLTFIGTALIVATGSSAAFAQSSRFSNFYDSVCGYTPQNRYCIGTNYQDRMMNSSDMMTQPNTSNYNQTNQPLNSNDNSRSPGTYQQTIPNQSSDRSNPGTAGNQDPGVIAPGSIDRSMNNGTSMPQDSDRTNSSGSLGNQDPERTNIPGNSGTGNQDPRVISPGSMSK